MVGMPRGAAVIEYHGKRGVVFRTPPGQAGPAVVAMFDDTCGNWIQLHQV